MSKLNYEQDLYIDPEALDYEWLNQPMLMLKYTEAAASARRELDRVKETLAAVRAGLDKKIRKDPEKYGITKVSETSISNSIIIQKDYIDAQEEVIEAQYEYQMTQGAVQAVDQRKQALENLSKLLGLQYFAGPKTPRDLPHEVQQQQKKGRANSTVQITRKRKS